MPTTGRQIEPSASSSLAELSWFGVARNALAGWWPLARGYVETALAEGPGDMAIDDVYRFLLSEHMQLWLLWFEGVRGAVVTEIAVYPRQKTCILRLFAATDGLRSAWLPMLGVIEAWAREKECCAVEVIGRAGWRRLLPEYRQTHVILRREL